MLDILLVDDEPSIRLSVGDALRAEGHQVTLASDGAEAMAMTQGEIFHVVITDVRLPQMDGMVLFRHIRKISPKTAVILITAYGEVSDAVAALKEGAYDYLTKPVDPEEITLRVARINKVREMERELEAMRQRRLDRGGGAGIIGRSPAIVQLLERIDTLAQSDAPVLITGESGTGKELVARSLHARSARRDAPFVAVNCAAFPETLLEAELFGHERGAFTGAIKKRDGRFKAADGGTLFLDEVAEIPSMAQAKLLRVLEDGVIEPLGTNTPVTVDVRIMSATHRKLKDRIGAGRFREDLYYRLNVLDIDIPPLRERRGDIPLLVEHFLHQFAREGAAVPSISPRSWAALSEYDFPGNVRELEHAIEHAVVLAGHNEIGLDHLPSDIAGSGADLPGTDASFRPLSVAVKEFEREYLLRALTLSSNKRTRAAELLGISRKNLWEKLRAHGITESRVED